MSNASYTRSFYTRHAMPTLIDCNFVVDSANGNGLGIRSLKGPGVKSVHMHTSSTPAGSVNPAAGYILVQLSGNFNYYYGGFSGQVAPLTGSPISISGSSVLTVGIPYVITSVGTSTTANWQAVGLPVGLTPTVGQSFLSTVTGGGSGTGTVEASGVSGIDHIEVVGDPNQSIAPIGYNVGVSADGSWFILKCIDAGSVTAPADNTAISLAFYLSNSSVATKGD